MDYIIVSDKAQFQLCGEVNKQNCRSAANPCLLHGKPLQGEMGIWFSLMCLAEKVKYVHTVYSHSIAFIWKAQISKCRLALLLYIYTIYIYTVLKFRLLYWHIFTLYKQTDAQSV